MNYEEILSNLTKKLLTPEEMKKIKENRYNELKNIYNKNKNLELEFNFINENKKIDELVKHNYSKNFLMGENFKGKNVLVMGINPGGGKTKYEIEHEVKSSILFATQNKDIFSFFNNYYIFTTGYHKANYEIFEKINAKAHWSIKNYLPDEEINKIIDNTIYLKKQNTGIECKCTKEERAKLVTAIRNMQNEENKKDGPFVVFGDLLWYSDVAQGNILSTLNEKKQNEVDQTIREIIKYNIEYYMPKLIVITNAYASDLVKRAINKKYENKLEDVLMFMNTPIILSAMVSGRRPIDKYSKFRLMDRIKEIYDNLNREV